MRSVISGAKIKFLSCCRPLHQEKSIPLHQGMFQWPSATTDEQILNCPKNQFFFCNFRGTFCTCWSRGLQNQGHVKAVPENRQLFEYVQPVYFSWITKDECTGGLTKTSCKIHQNYHFAHSASTLASHSFNPKAKLESIKFSRSVWSWISETRENARNISSVTIFRDFHRRRTPSRDTAIWSQIQDIQLITIPGMQFLGPNSPRSSAGDKISKTRKSRFFCVGRAHPTPLPSIT